MFSDHSWIFVTEETNSIANLWVPKVYLSILSILKKVPEYSELRGSL